MTTNPDAIELLRHNFANALIAEPKQNTLHTAEAILTNMGALADQMLKDHADNPAPVLMAINGALNFCIEALEESTLKGSSELAAEVREVKESYAPPMV